MPSVHCTLNTLRKGHAQSEACILSGWASHRERWGHFARRGGGEHRRLRHGDGTFGRRRTCYFHTETIKLKIRDVHTQFFKVKPTQFNRTAALETYELRWLQFPPFYTSALLVTST